MGAWKKSPFEESWVAILPILIRLVASFGRVMTDCPSVYARSEDMVVLLFQFTT